MQHVSGVVQLWSADSLPLRFFEEAVLAVEIMASYRLTEIEVVNYAVNDAKKMSNSWAKYLTHLDKYLEYNLNELAKLKEFWARKDSK